MDTRQFLEAVWPDQGLYCIAIPAQPRGYRHHVATTLDDAVQYVESVKANNNVFFCVHTLKDEKVWNPNRKNYDNTVGGYSVRTQVNMRSCKVFFFDLDVGPEDAKYQTQQDALDGIDAFVEKTGLPAPMLVSSGGGVHVYFLLTEEVSTMEWVQRAARLKALANAEGLKIDPARTTDTSSVLRVATTFNLKNGGRRLVEVLDDGDAPVSLDEWDTALDRACQDMPIVTTTPAARPMVSGLGSNTGKNFSGPPLTAVELIQQCPQMARMMATRGNISQPEWYAGLSVVRELRNGNKLIHKFSDGYLGYTAAETEMKAAQASNYGPASCKKLYDVSSPVDQQLCLQCPHWEKFKGPLDATRKLLSKPPPKITAFIDDKLETIEIPNPPMPYKRGKHGGIEILKEDSETKKQYTETIHPYDLYPLGRARNSFAQTETQTWRHHQPHGDPHDFDVSASQFSNDHALRDVLANNGIYPGTRFNAVRNYMSAYISELIAQTPVGKQHTHLGWTADKTGFVLPDRMIMRDGSVERALLSTDASVMEDLVCTAGDAQTQVDLMNFYNRPEYAAHMFYITASLASVHMSATDEHGIVVHATGPTSAGKSTVFYTAASLWGPPKKFSINGLSNASTINGRDGRIQALGNLPFMADELGTDAQSDRMRDLVMSVTQPQGGKIRSTKTGGERRTTEAERASVVITNGNKSMYDMLSHDAQTSVAASVRVLEIALPGLDKTPEEQIQAARFKRMVERNFGHIGEHYLRFTVPRYEKVEAQTQKTIDRLIMQYNPPVAFRIHINLIAAVIVASSVAKARGLLPFDPAVLENWAMHVHLPRLMGVVSQEEERIDPVTVFTDFMMTHQSNILVSTKLQNNPRHLEDVKPVGELIGHLRRDTMQVAILRDAFRRYCTKRGVSPVTILNTLHAANIVPITNTRRALGEGTNWERGRSACFVADLTQPAIAATSPLRAVASGPAQGPIPVPANQP